MLDLVLGVAVGRISNGHLNCLVRHRTTDNQFIRRIPRDHRAVYCISIPESFAFSVGVGRRVAIAILIVNGQRMRILGIVNNEFIVTICSNFERNVRINCRIPCNRFCHVGQLGTDLCSAGLILSDLSFSTLQIVVDRVATFRGLIVSIQNQARTGIAGSGIFELVVGNLFLIRRGNSDRLSKCHVALYGRFSNFLAVQIHVLNGITGISNLVIHKGNGRFFTESGHDRSADFIARNRLSVEHVGVAGKAGHFCGICQHLTLCVHIIRGGSPGCSLGVGEDNFLIRRLDLDGLARRIRGVARNFRRLDGHILTSLRTVAFDSPNFFAALILGDNDVVAGTAVRPFSIQSHIGNDLLLFHKGLLERFVSVPADKGIACALHPIAGIRQRHTAALEDCLSRYSLVAVGHKRNSIGRLLPNGVQLQIVGRHSVFFPVNLVQTSRVVRPTDKIVITFYRFRATRFNSGLGTRKQSLILEGSIVYASAIFKCNGIAFTVIVNLGRSPRIVIKRRFRRTPIILGIKPFNLQHIFRVSKIQSIVRLKRYCSVQLPITIQRFDIMLNRLLHSARHLLTIQGNVPGDVFKNVQPRAIVPLIFALTPQISSVSIRPSSRNISSVFNPESFL